MATRTLFFVLYFAFFFGLPRCLTSSPPFIFSICYTSLTNTPKTEREEHSPFLAELKSDFHHYCSRKHSIPTYLTSFESRPLFSAPSTVRSKTHATVKGVHRELYQGPRLNSSLRPKKLTKNKPRLTTSWPVKNASHEWGSPYCLQGSSLEKLLHTSFSAVAPNNGLLTKHVGRRG